MRVGIADGDVEGGERQKVAMIVVSLVARQHSGQSFEARPAPFFALQGRPDAERLAGVFLMDVLDHPVFDRFQQENREPRRPIEAEAS